MPREYTGSMPDDRRPLTGSNPGRSRISNGHKRLADVDGRSAVARRHRNIANAILAEQDEERVTETRLQLIRRFAAASVLAEQLEAKVANGEEISIQEHAALCSTLVPNATSAARSVHCLSSGHEREAEPFRRGAAMKAVE